MNEPRVWPENFWRDVWHDNCPKMRSAPMKHLSDRLEIEDGSILRLYKCAACGDCVFAGLDAERRLVHRAPQTLDTIAPKV